VDLVGFVPGIGKGTEYSCFLSVLHANYGWCAFYFEATHVMVYTYVMEHNLVYTLISIIAVVFVFLFAIEKFSKQVQYLAGDKFKYILEKMTKNTVNGTISWEPSSLRSYNHLLQQQSWR
jgi:uncharacterized membrane-anchored protein YitT (DUF2179 family)